MNQEKINDTENMKVFLEGLSFEEKEGKEGLWFKPLIKNGIKHTLFWDLRKQVPFFYVYEEGKEKPIAKKENGTFEEYMLFSEKFNIKEEKGKPKDNPVPSGSQIQVLEHKDYMRGTEENIIQVMDKKLQLDSIILASDDKSKPGEGILWHELNFGSRIHKEPSVELVDMIAQDMGSITTRIVEFGTNVLEDPNTHNKYLTYFCVVEAKDGVTGTSGLGASEQIIDFNEINSGGRTFARTNAIRKAERNAKERMIPIPRKAFVELVIRKLEDHQKGKKQSSS